MKKTGVIIGFGGMGGWHGNHMLKSDVVRLKGIVDIDPKRDEAAAEKGIFAYPSKEAALADREVDFVTIAVPNDVHKSLVIEALAAGKHVICEKPATLSLADLDEMIAASEKYGKLFTVHQNRRWDPDFLMTKQAYDSGELGEVFRLESRVQGSRGIPGDWRGKPECGGGMILDWGVHLIDQVLQIIKNDIARIYCRCEHITNYAVDDGFSLDILFRETGVARIEVGTSNFISLPRFYLAGANGGAMVGDWREKCRVVCCKNWDEKDVIPVVTAAGLTKTMAPRNEKTVTEYEIERPEPDVHDFYRNFCAAMDGREKQIVTHDQLRLVMRVMEAAFESDRQGQVINFK